MSGVRFLIGEVYGRIDGRLMDSHRPGETLKARNWMNVTPAQAKNA
jgi:hypothetical protein